MKRLNFWIIAAVCLGVTVLGAVPAAAQTSSVEAEIPFAFVVGDQLLPAGGYRFIVETDHKLTRITELSGKRVWQVRLIAGGTDRSESSLEKGLLRFTKIGDRYLLNTIWRAGYLTGSNVMRSKLPRELAQSGEVRQVSSTR